MSEIDPMDALRRANPEPSITGNPGRPGAAGGAEPITPIDPVNVHFSAKMRVAAQET